MALLDILMLHSNNTRNRTGFNFYSVMSLFSSQSKLSQQDDGDLSSMKTVVLPLLALQFLSNIIQQRSYNGTGSFFINSIVMASSYLNSNNNNNYFHNTNKPSNQWYRQD